MLLLLGMCGGIILAFAYINPYDSRISLSELVLQLSGSRGEFALGFSFPELISFSAKNVPYILFELYMGVSLYRHFCTASVYVFSRTPNRVLWYEKECATLLTAVLFYQLVLLASAIAVTCCRYEVVWNEAGFAIMTIHAVFYALWLFAMTLLVNVLSILVGSEFAFTVAFGGQAVLITLLALLRALEGSRAYAAVRAINPISHLIIGWHTSPLEWLGRSLHAPEPALSLSISLVILTLIPVLILILGGVLIQKRDLIVADYEFGGA